MAYSHFKTSSTVVDGKLLVIGGEEKGGNKLTATEYIDLDGEVTPGPDLPLPLRSHCAVTLTTGKAWSVKIEESGTQFWQTHMPKLWANWL